MHTTQRHNTNKPIWAKLGNATVRFKGPLVLKAPFPRRRIDPRKLVNPRKVVREMKRPKPIDSPPRRKLESPPPKPVKVGRDSLLRAGPDLVRRFNSIFGFNVRGL